MANSRIDCIEYSLGLIALVLIMFPVISISCDWVISGYKTVSSHMLYGVVGLGLGMQHTGVLAVMHGLDPYV